MKPTTVADRLLRRQEPPSASSICPVMHRRQASADSPPLQGRGAVSLESLAELLSPHFNLRQCLA